MDFSRLANDAAFQKQLAEQLLSHSYLRDAVMKAQESDSDTDSETQKATAPVDSGLDNLLDQLSQTLSQPSESASGTTPQQGLNAHPLIQMLFDELPQETADELSALFEQLDPEVALNTAAILNAIPGPTVEKIQSLVQELDAADISKAMTFFGALFTQDKDRVFYQRENLDTSFNAENLRAVSGADLDDFLRTAYQLSARGADLGAFLEAGTEVLQKGDYDDFRRFLDGAAIVNHRGESLETYYAFGSELLETAPHDYESNVFQLYNTLAHRGSLQNYLDIAGNLQTTGFEGRNNLVDLTRIVVDFRKAGGYMPMLFQALSEEAAYEDGDVRAFMDSYMETRSLADTRPDFNLFDRIERIDGDPMVIQEGESAALFAQAISTADGLLPESTLFWSSRETGALSNGSSYLDLSTLPPGTYHIAAKIGNYGNSTDTALKTVIVEPAATQTEDLASENAIELPASGNLKVTVKKGSAYLRSDVFLRQNGLDTLITERAQASGEGIVLEKDYQAGDKLDFYIKTFGGKRRNQPYIHGTHTEEYEGKPFAKVEALSENSWRIFFEDLPGDKADWDYDDVVIDVELIVADAAPEILSQSMPSLTGGIESTLAAGESEEIPADLQAKISQLEELIATTEQALTALENGASIAEIGDILNDRYYASLDNWVADNLAYANSVQDLRLKQSAQDIAALGNSLQDILRRLRGEGEEELNQAQPAQQV